MPAQAISLSKLSFTYPGAQAPTLAIDNFDVDYGQHTFLHGPSGSGKTTLLGLIAGILDLQTGDLNVCGKPMHSLSSHARDQLRGDELGYIFQMFNLIPYLSVSENIGLPCQISANRRERCGGSVTEQINNLADRLGMAALLDKPVTSLSVGQQQRVAAARALIGSPRLIIADEPTSALDADHREAFIKLLFAEADQAGSTILFVSHDHSLKNQFSSQVALRDINSAASEVASYV